MQWQIIKLKFHKIAGSSIDQKERLLTFAKCDSNLYPINLLVIPMYICMSPSLYTHSYVVNERLNRLDCDLQIDIGIRADELGIIPNSSGLHVYIAMSILSSYE
jgi:hypothetical protein